MIGISDNCSRDLNVLMNLQFHPVTFILSYYRLALTSSGKSSKHNEQRFFLASGSFYLQKKTDSHFGVTNPACTLYHGILTGLHSSKKMKASSGAVLLEVGEKQ